jgi:hypothetical protein
LRNYISDGDDRWSLDDDDDDVLQKGERHHWSWLVLIAEPFLLLVWFLGVLGQNTRQVC